LDGKDWGILILRVYPVEVFFVSQESMCWQSCLAVMWDVFHFLTWYIVLWICILWLSTSSTSRPCSIVVGVIGEDSVCVAADHLSVVRLLLERLMRVSKLIGV
jgi:hypothetical protein